MCVGKEYIEYTRTTGTCEHVPGADRYLDSLQKHVNVLEAQGSVSSYTTQGHAILR